VFLVLLGHQGHPEVEGRRERINKEGRGGEEKEEECICYRF